MKTSDQIWAEAGALANELGMEARAYVLQAVDTYNQQVRAEMDAQREGIVDPFGEAAAE